MIFCRADKNNIIAIEKCLDQYCKWTDQAINTAKSRIFFSKNTSGATKAEVKHVLNLKELAKDSKYLGNPIHVGTNKAKAFDNLRCQIESKFHKPE